MSQKSLRDLVIEALKASEEGWKKNMEEVIKLRKLLEEILPKEEGKREIKDIPPEEEIAINCDKLPYQNNHDKNNYKK